MAPQRGQDQNRGGGDTSNRGFASMDPEKQRAIAAEGGRAAHAQGVAHEFDSEEAREAGRKGGQARGGGDTDRDQQGSARGGGSRSASSGSRERDSQGRFTDSDDNNRGGGMSASGRGGQERERDSQGRFTDSDDNDRGGNRGGRNG
jgi:general stress protein YciG